MIINRVNKNNIIFQSAPVLDIDSTLNKEINKYPNNVIPYVVIRGLVKPLGNPITSNYNQSITGVIQRYVTSKIELI